MLKSTIALSVQVGILLAAGKCTHSLSGFLVTGGGLMLLADRYAFGLLARSPDRWKRELTLRVGSWLMGATGFYFMRPGIVPLWEAAYRGIMVCLTVVVLEFALTVGRRNGQRGWSSLRLRASLLGLLILLIPVIASLHPLHTVPKRTPAAMGFAFEDVPFQTSDGVRLTGWLIPHPQPRGNVIFCHGHGRNRGHVAGYLQTLHGLGVNVLSFDFRGHGDSEGHTSTFGRREVNDLYAAVAFMNKRFPGQPVVLVGVSLGAAVALQALPDLPQVGGVWSEAAFARLSSTADYAFSPLPVSLRRPVLGCCFLLGWLDCGVWAPAVNPIDRLNGVTVPIFFCHGTMDELVPIADGQALYASYTGPREQWWVQGARRRIDRLAQFTWPMARFAAPP
jgi:fermentation-respiration switch protein FrsA (DUF1100 family)